MNQSTGGHLTLTQHRKIAVSLNKREGEGGGGEGGRRGDIGLTTQISFRDKSLLRIFQISLNSLKQLTSSTSTITDGTILRQHRMQCTNTFLQHQIKLKTSRLNLLYSVYLLTLQVQHLSVVFNIRSQIEGHFLGITPDESSEDLGIVQIPSSWRSIFEEENGTLTLFLDLYRTSVPPQSTQVFEV